MSSLLLFLTLVSAPADRTPRLLEGVGVEEQLEVKLPLDLELFDSSGRKVRLGDYFDGEKPVILTLNYSDCPMLCNLQLNGLVEGLRGLDWSAGEEFEIVTISLDPKESPKRAAETQARYEQVYGRNSGGWHFLTGPETNIKTLAATVGFHYRYVEERREYAHAAALILSTPDGRVARYLYGVQYPAATLRFGLLEASKGRIGGAVDRILLYCFHYDPEEGRYTPVVTNVMRIGAGGSALILAAFIARLFLREKRVAR